MGRDIHQHVFSAWESAEGLIYGGLCFYKQSADAERVINNSLFQAMTVSAEDFQYVRTDQNQSFGFDYLARRSHNGVDKP